MSLSLKNVEAVFVKSEITKQKNEALSYRIQRIFFFKFRQFTKLKIQDYKLSSFCFVIKPHACAILQTECVKEFVHHSGSSDRPFGNLATS